MREVQATEAKAHLVPAEAQARASRRLAVERFESWRAGWKGIDMSVEEILAVRHEGHRY